MCEQCSSTSYIQHVVVVVSTVIMNVHRRLSAVCHFLLIAVCSFPSAEVLLSHKLLHLARIRCWSLYLGCQRRLYHLLPWAGGWHVLKIATPLGVYSKLTGCRLYRVTMTATGIQLHTVNWPLVSCVVGRWWLYRTTHSKLMVTVESQVELTESHDDTLSTVLSPLSCSLILTTYAWSPSLSNLNVWNMACRYTREREALFFSPHTRRNQRP